MNKILLSICVSILLLGCDPTAQKYQADQCLRVELYKTCMSSLPKGPVTTNYNDWDEVVKACDDISYSQSRRKATLIREECRYSP